MDEVKSVVFMTVIEKGETPVKHLVMEMALMSSTHDQHFSSLVDLHEHCTEKGK